MRGPNRVFDAIRTLEFALAFLTFCSSAYILSPLYHYAVVHNGLSIFGQSLGSVVYIKLWAAALLIGSVLIFIGLARNLVRLRSAGLLAICVCRFFQALTTVLFAGLLPLVSWIYILTISVFALILWIRCRVEIHGP